MVETRAARQRKPTKPEEEEEKHTPPPEETPKDTKPKKKKPKDDDDDEDEERKEQKRRAAETKRRLTRVVPAKKKAGSGANWFGTCALTTVYGAFGFLLLRKKLGDPAFSDWASPGPGQLLLGDAGRLAWFEFGPEGVSSKMLGCPAWLLEAGFLALGCAGVVLTWSTKPDHIEASAYLVSCEGIYYLTACVYYVLLGLPWAVAAYASMGAALCGLCLYRVGWYLPRGPEHYDKYEGLKAWQCLLACFGIMLGGKLVARAGPDALEADVAAFKDVRAHFFANGRAWTKGAAYPDGYNVSG